jgi:ATP-dependent Clp protease ATP-binding subunit ClpA
MSSVSFISDGNIFCFGQKIVDRCVPYRALNTQLECIKQKVSANAAYILNDSEISQVKEAFINCNNFFSEKLLRNLTQLPLNQVKNAVFQALSQNNETTIKACLERFLTAIEEKNFVEFSRIDVKLLEDILEKALLLKNKALDASLYTKSKALGKEMCYEISYFCHHLIETFISFAGFNEIGEERRRRFNDSGTSSFEAKAKVEIYLALLAYPSILFVAALSFTGSALLAGIVATTIVVASILFVPIYIRKLRPCPRQYAGLENLNQKILRNESAPMFQRVDILDRIQDAFCAGKGVVLTGGPGAGKTSIAESLASLIVAKSAKKGADFLNGAQMFSCNANQVKDISSYDTLNFQSLAEHFKNHSKAFVLFVDEIASLYDKGSFTGNSVKSFLTFLDRFPNVLTATTIKEYEEHIKNDDPVNRRLVHIEVKPLQPQELESSLFQYLHYKAPELVVEENVISYIIDKAAEFNPKTSQIDGAMSLLKSAIIKVTHITFEGLEKQVNDLKLEIDSLENHLFHGKQTGSTETMKEYRRKQTDLKAVQDKLSAQQKILDQIKKIEALSLKVKYQGYKLADKGQTEKPLNSRKWVVNHAVHEILADFLMSERKNLGLPEGITKGLVDEIVASGKKG